MYKTLYPQNLSKGCRKLNYTNTLSNTDYPFDMSALLFSFDFYLVFLFVSAVLKIKGFFHVSNIIYHVINSIFDQERERDVTNSTFDRERERET